MTSQVMKIDNAEFPKNMVKISLNKFSDISARKRQDYLSMVSFPSKLQKHKSLTVPNLLGTRFLYFIFLHEWGWGENEVDNPAT